MHEIKTQFQLINLFDEMLIKKTSSTSISVKTNLGTSIDGEENIVFDAVRSLSNYIGKEIHCDIEIVKNIPLGGGLGGGSSNAAAALIGINFLFKLGLSLFRINEAGQKTWSRCTFFYFWKKCSCIWYW